MPEISVVIPVSNVFKNLDTILLSLFTQSFPNIEIILINNNCDENVTKLINNYAKFDSRIKVINLSEKISATKCCRIGAEYSNCEYITFLDSSKRMFYAQSSLNRMLKNIKRNNADFVYCGNLVQELGTFKLLRIFQVSIKQLIQKENFKPRDLQPESLFKLNLSIYGKLFKREFFNSVPSTIFDETYFLNLFFAAKTIAYDDICLCVMTVDKQELLKPNEIAEQNANLELLKKLNLPEIYKEECIRHKIWRYCINLYYMPEFQKQRFSEDMRKDLIGIDLQKYSVIGEMI